MKNMIIICTFLALVSCASSGPKTNNSVQTGWIDEDTYMVNVTGADEETAIAMAKHQILKDIVEVRMRNNSRYTDIEKIREEFTMPLQNGIIIKKTVIPKGLQIYYQIRDKGLKLKFQRI
jgi:hypothetical protein